MHASVTQPRLGRAVARPAAKSKAPDKGRLSESQKLLPELDEQSINFRESDYLGYVGSTDLVFDLLVVAVDRLH